MLNVLPKSRIPVPFHASFCIDQVFLVSSFWWLMVFDELPCTCKYDYKFTIKVCRVQFGRFMHGKHNKQKRNTKQRDFVSEIVC